MIFYILFIKKMNKKMVSLHSSFPPIITGNIKMQDGKILGKPEGKALDFT